MVKGQKFGELELKNTQQVTALMTALKPLITAHVNKTTTEHDLKQLYQMQNDTTKKHIDTVTTKVIIDQHTNYFKNTLTKKVVK